VRPTPLVSWLQGKDLNRDLWVMRPPPPPARTDTCARLGEPASAEELLQIAMSDDVISRIGNRLLPVRVLW
jgi:hypothetical protein